MANVGVAAAEDDEEVLLIELVADDERELDRELLLTDVDCGTVDDMLELEVLDTDDEDELILELSA